MTNPTTATTSIPMENMIWYANKILDTILEPETTMVPRDLLMDCRGVALISAVEAGCLVSCTVGTGLIMIRNNKNNNNKTSWSPPSAIGLGGVGFGVKLGVNSKDLVLLLFDDDAITALSGDNQIHFGADVGFAAGRSLGRQMGGSLNYSSGKGGGTAGMALSYAFSKGLFVNAGGLQGCYVKSRNKENERFYGRVGITPQDILFQESRLSNDIISSLPLEKDIEELHGKLDLMMEGKTRRGGGESLNSTSNDSSEGEERSPVLYSEKDIEEGRDRK